MPSFPWDAYRLIRQHDVVSLHTPLPEAPLLTFLARRLGKSSVITHHGDLALPGGLTNHFIQMAMFVLFRIAVRFADHIIAYSDDYAEHSKWVSPYLTKTSAVYPPVEIPEPTKGGPQRLRQSLGLDSKPVLGYAGRFVEEKRPDILLRALPHLDKEFPGAEIVFAGQYKIPYEDFYERCAPLIQRCENRLHFLGMIEDDRELANFYAACDALVLPSSTECFGLVQVEAMLCGTPVVATDIPGAREPVRVSGMGEIAAPRDPLALSRAIARVLRNRDQYVKPREEIERIFNFKHTVDSYEEILQSSVRGS